MYRLSRFSYVLGIFAFCCTAFAARAQTWIPNVVASANSAQVPGFNGAFRIVTDDGLTETAPGSGIYQLSKDAVGYSAGYVAQAGRFNDETPYVQFDLGSITTVNQFHVWNENSAGYNFRGFRDVTLQSSNDGILWKTYLRRFQFARAPGTDTYLGERFTLEYPIAARYLRFCVNNNWRAIAFGGGNPDVAGFGRTRFFAGGTAVTPPTNNTTFPGDSGIVNVKLPPYNAQGDGVTDDTAALRQAIRDWQGTRQTIYLPDGVYLVSDTLRLQNGSGGGNTNIRGQSRTGTVLRLKSNSFTNVAAPKAVLDMAYNGNDAATSVSADWFNNNVSDITIDVLANNAGAIGLRFYSNNVGAARNITLHAPVGTGQIGLDLGYVDQNGPLFVKDVRIEGFAVGVSIGGTVNSQTLEAISLSGQSQYGIRGSGQCLTVRGLTSINSVPALSMTFGFTTLIDANLQGTGTAATVPAIEYGEFLFARNIVTSGYQRAIAGDGYAGGTGVAAASVTEYASSAPVQLFNSPRQSLNLPIRETPMLPNDDPGTWANVRNFRLTSETDDSAAFQRAIDSGATTVYFPGNGNYYLGSPVEIRGNVRRVIGMHATIYTVGAAPFKVVNGTSPTVALEDIFIGFGSDAEQFNNTSIRTVVLKNHLGMGGNVTGTGDLFLENVVGDWVFNGQNVWFRQFNAEKRGLHISNNGANLWILGLKTESLGTLLETKNGGATELLGGLSYTAQDGRLYPMFIVDNARFSTTLGEVCYSGDPYTVLVQETRGLKTRELLRGQAPMRYSFMNGSALPLYVGYEQADRLSAPAIPQISAGDTQAALTWDEVAGAVSYKIRRSAARAGTYTDIAANLTVPGYTDMGLANDATQFYQVIAVFPNGTETVSPIAYTTPRAANSTGFAATYFNDSGNGLYFQTLATTRTDNAISFDWGNGSPGAGVQADNFSARWTGWVTAPQTGTYTFYATTDDGVHLWVNGVRLVNAWYGQAPTEYSGSISLSAGQSVPVVMDYYEGGGGAAAKLEWSGAGVARQLLVGSLPPSTVTLSGRLVFEDIKPSSSSVSVAFTLRPTDNSGNVTRTVALDSKGDFVLAGIPHKSGILHIKSTKYLAVNLAVSAGNGDVSGLGGILRAGDSNNDNRVDVADLLAIINNYNKTAATGGYLDTADFNSDGVNDVADLLLVIRNYNRAGAP